MHAYISLLKVLPNSTTPLGDEVLKSRGFFTQSKWYWIGVGALIGYTIVFNIAYILALTYLNREILHLKNVFATKRESLVCILIFSQIG